METKENANAEPKLDFRFIVEFPESFNIPSQLVRAITLPKWIRTLHGNWSNMQIDLLESVVNSPTRTFYEMIKNEKDSFTFQIKIVDPTEKVLDTWTIDVGYICEIDFGVVDYRGHDVIKTTIILSPTNCTLES